MNIFSGIRDYLIGSSDAHYVQLPADILNYAAHSYPSNHTFHIRKGCLRPKRDLKKRYNALSPLFSQPLTSLLDIGCSKGYFVLTAAQQSTCQRALGIDITRKEIDFCNVLKHYLSAKKAQFELLQLDQLSQSISSFGGPFQTVLVINLYQYLFFGSDQYANGFFDHDKIFHYLANVCSDRVIFNNRLELADCQNQSWVQKAGDISKVYSQEQIYAAASKYFHVQDHGTYGRYPLWVLEKF